MSPNQSYKLFSKHLIDSRWIGNFLRFLLVVSMLLTNFASLATNTASASGEKDGIGSENAPLGMDEYSPNQAPLFQAVCDDQVEDLVVGTGVTCYWDPGSYYYTTVTIQSGGTIIARGNTSNGTGIEVEAETFLVESGGNLTATGQGYPGATGPGAGTSAGSGASAGGGGYGGWGGASATAGGVPYGDVFEPTSLGSGGGSRDNEGGGSGGGAIHLYVTNALTVTGTIEANGTMGGESYGGTGGGAGGSIWIETAQIQGNGLIKADGANGVVSGYGGLFGTGGGGAGGRISIDTPINGFSGTVQAYGGEGGQDGGPGTIYWADENRLVINDQSDAGASSAIVEGNYEFSTLQIINQATLTVIGTNSSYFIGDGTMAGDGTGRLNVQGNMSVDDTYVFENITVDAQGFLDEEGSIEIGSLGRLILRASTPIHTGAYQLGDVTVGSSGKLTLVPANDGDTDYEDDEPFHLIANSLTIDSGGVVESNGQGYKGKDGNGYGPGGGLGTTSGNGYERGGGGGYGGNGGNGSGSFYGGSSYGTVQPPLKLGSAGGSGLVVTTKYLGANGGGAIFLEADEITINGILSANGANGDGRSSPAPGGSGGGSGGSINILTNSIDGSGQIQANGGSSTYGGGGGGGRIAIGYMDVQLYNIDPNLSLLTQGGAGYNNGSNGSEFIDIFDWQNSTFSIQPNLLLADGTSTGTITVTAVNLSGYPMPDLNVTIELENGFDDVYINDQLVTVGWSGATAIGQTNAQGVITATLKANTPGERSLVAWIGPNGIEEDFDSVLVNFVSGFADPNLSQVDADPVEAPADDITPVTITTLALNSSQEPVEGATVVLSASGDAQITQPVQTTDVQGIATGTITNGTSQTVTVSVIVDGIPIVDTAEVQFRYADLAAMLTAPQGTYPGANFTYQVHLTNDSPMEAANVVLTQTLPSEVDFVSQTSQFGLSQQGDALIWSIGTLDAYEQLSIDVNVFVPETVLNGTYLDSELEAHTNTQDENPNNNTDSTSTLVTFEPPYTASLSPGSLTLNLGGAAATTLHLSNVYTATDQYTITIEGIDPGWITIDPESLVLPVGGSAEIPITITPPGCQAETTLPFTVTVTNATSPVHETALNGQVSLVQAPQILLDAPANGITTGSNTVLFGWRTNPETTGTLTVYPTGHPEQAQVFTTTLSSTHSTLVESLTHDQTYEWQVEAISSCGTAQSATQIFTVSTGIVFDDHTMSETIERDYYQIVEIEVRNDDSVQHTLLMTVQNPYEDLIVNFVGSGSVDEEITLNPSETLTVELSVNAQDALAHDYQLLVVITADEGGDPLIDIAQIDLAVLFDGDYSVSLLGTDPGSGAVTYRFTNNGTPITDFQINTLDSATGLPASVYMTPNVSHARLDTSESVDVQFVPLYGAQQIGQQGPAINFNMITQGSGVEQTTPATAGCAPGTQVYEVTRQNVCMQIETRDWYCTNRPDVATLFNTPDFLDPDSVESIDLWMEVSPWSNVQPHTSNFSFNGMPLGGFSTSIPFGQYSLNIPASSLNASTNGPAVQSFGITSQHPNSGHYVVASNFTLGIGLENVTTYVCANSQQAAEASVDHEFGFETISRSPLCGSGMISDGSTMSSSSDACVGSSVTGTQAKEGRPINTRNGAYDYSYSDLSVATSAGPLTFQRWYASQGTEIYTDTLGAGWTHSLDTRLIFPDDPEGQAGVVLFKVHSANQYEFTINPDGSFTPFDGICGSLIRNDGPPVTYIFTDNAQRTYTFNEEGRLLTLSDPQGRSLHYIYSNGLLTRVEDDSGTRYLALNHSGNRLISVQDHSGRQVTFGYTGDNLTSTTDVNGQIWTYQYNDQAHLHHLTSVTDPQSKIVERTEFDAQGRAVRQYDGEDNLLVELEYNGFGTSRVVDAYDQLSTHIYNGQNTQIEAKDPLGRETHKTYDPNFRPTTITDPAGNTSEMTWSENGANLLELLDALGQATSLDYDGLNNLTELVDGRGVTTTYNYSGTLLTASLDALSNETQYTYTTPADAPQPPGLLKTVTDPLNNTTSYNYDALGQLTRVTDASSNYTEYTYDSLGRLKITDRPGVGGTRLKDWTCYDNAGRVTRTTRNASWNGSGPDPCDPAYQPSGEVDEDRISETRYDSSGNAIAQIEWVVEDSQVLTRTTRTYYDNDNRPTSVVRNLSGQAIEVNQPPASGALTNETNLRSDTYYDQAGNMIASVEWIVEGSTVFTRTNRTYYDLLGRPEYSVQNLANWDWQTTSPPPEYLRTAEENITMRTYYDANDNAIATRDPEGRITRTYYDALNRPILVVQNLDPGIDIVNSTPQDVTCSRNEGAVVNICSETYYDENGNVIGTVDPAGTVNRTYYDALNRPFLSVQNVDSGDIFSEDLPTCDTSGAADSYLCTWTTYDDGGNAIATTDPVGTITRTYYDSLNRAYLVVRNLEPQHGIQTETPPTCNRDASGLLDPYNICSETKYDPYTGQAIASIDPLGRVTRTYYDSLNRPYLVLRNLTAQGYEVTTPPEPSEYGNEQNAATETVYDGAGNAIAQIEWLVGSGQVISHTTRTFFDTLNRPVANVSGYVGDLDAATPPVFDPDFPDRNVRLDTVYASDGSAIATIEFLADEVGEPFTRTTRTYYDGLRRSLKVVRNLDPAWDYENPSAPACNRDAEGDDPPYNVCSETTYNVDGSVSASTDALGYVTSYTYDDLSRTIQTTNPLTHTTGYSYDVLGNRRSVTDAEGVVTRFEYDGLGRLTAVIENYDPPLNPDSETNVRTEYTYDGLGNRLTILDGEDHTTTFGYDALGRLASESDALSHTWQYRYDAAGNRVRMTDANGETTLYVYDGLNRPVETDFPAPDADVTFDFNALGWRTAMTDGLGLTSWEYDALGRPLTITHPISGTVGYRYDAAGNRTQLTYPEQKLVSYTYDSLGRLAQVEDWDAQVVSYTYDVNGRMLGVERPNGVSSTYTFDPTGNLLSLAHDSLSEQLASYVYEYDALGNRLSAAESLAQPVPPPTSTITIDGFETGDFSGWTSVITDSGDLSVTAQAALSGQYGMQALIDNAGLIYAKDDTPDQEDEIFVRFDFDPNSITLLNMKDFSLLRVMDTELFDIMIGFGKMNGNYILQGGAWDEGINRFRVSSLATISDAPHTIEFYWKTASAAGANDGIFQMWVDDTRYANITNLDNDAQRLLSVEMGMVGGFDSGTSGTIYYDNYESYRENPEQMLMMLGGGEEESSPALSAAADYVMDLFREIPKGRGLRALLPAAQTALLETILAQEALTRTISYSYDPLYRLTAADYDDGGYFHYVYDAVGNRELQLTEAYTNTYTYDEANRLTAVDSITYTWDANGNLLDDGAKSYEYDLSNRLVSVDDGQAEVTFEYNGLGDRMQQSEGGNTTTYTLDIATGLTQVLSDGTDAYLYGAERIAQEGTSGKEYFLGDALGSVRQLVDAEELVTLTKSYEPYGEMLSSAGTGMTSYGFTNEWTDSTGLIYLRSRFYSPYLNQFNQPDPIVLSPYTPEDWNRYPYARNNPINLTDPSGLSPIVNCSQWANPILANLCKASNGNDNDKATLDAREQLFSAIAYGGTLRGVVGSGWREPNDIGYLWAAVMLVHFLDGNGSRMNIVFSASDPFVNDPGITRATRGFGEPASRDETDTIIPLLHSFLTNYVQPNANLGGITFTVGPDYLIGKDHYFNSLSKQLGLEPRARSQGFWAAFGHVVIDGTFTAEGKYSCRLEKYLIGYSAQYLIKDHYGWFHGKTTPFPFGHGGSTVWIPHEWELSLVQAGRAAEYDFTISWIERDRLSVAPDFSQYTQAHWWDW